MKKGMKLSSEQIDDNYKVVEVEEDEKLAKKGSKIIAGIGITTLAIAIIFVISAYSISEKNNKSNNKDKDPIKEYSITSDIVDTIDKSEKKVKTKEVDFNQTEIINNVTYTNINKFYRHIVENRYIYGDFAEVFQSEDDVRNFVNFIYLFNDLNNKDISSSINSKEEFDEIVSEYYKSCIKNDIKGELNILFENQPVYKNKLAESEELAYDLKNGKGDDYTIANKYYTWFGENLCDDRTAIDSIPTNAPLIEALRWQYEEYRNSGNMLDARKYQKNDSLPISSYEIYYAEPNPEDVEVIEIQNSFSCPDWGIDNVVSPTEEDTETKLVIKENGERLFLRVEETFNSITSKQKLRG